jgi:hypothetical protein
LEDRCLPSFLAPVAYPVGAQPAGVAVGDVDGDGVPDLVTVNAGGNSVSVLRGQGDGTFAGAVDYPVGARPGYVALADLEGNGLPDIVTTNAADNSVSVLLNNGDGTFAPAVTYASGGVNPGPVAVGDFNGDGIPDLVVVNRGVSRFDFYIKVLLGNGDGTFQPAGRGFFITADSLGAGDFHGNGRLDLAIAIFDGVEHGGTNTAQVLRNRGDATFLLEPGTDLDTFGRSHDLLVGDFDGDGKLDVAVTGPNLDVLRGRGDGTFGPPESYNVRAGLAALVDVNGDGLSDIVWAQAGFGQSLGGVLLGNGDGTFQDGGTFSQSGVGISAVATGDLTGAGASDVVLANPDTNTVSVLLNAHDWGSPGPRAPGHATHPAAGLRGRAGGAERQVGVAVAGAGRVGGELGPQTGVTLPVPAEETERRLPLLAGPVNPGVALVGGEFRAENPAGARTAVPHWSPPAPADLLWTPVPALDDLV